MSNLASSVWSERWMSATTSWAFWLSDREISRRVRKGKCLERIFVCVCVCVNEMDLNAQENKINIDFSKDSNFLDVMTSNVKSLIKVNFTASFEQVFSLSITFIYNVFSFFFLNLHI